MSNVTTNDQFLAAASAVASHWGVPHGSDSVTAFSSMNAATNAAAAYGASHHSGSASSSGYDPSQAVVAMYHQHLTAHAAAAAAQGGVVPTVAVDDDTSLHASPSKSPAHKDGALSVAKAASRPHLRKAGGEIWNDPTLDEWPNEDFRVFCGDLGNEVTDEVLGNAFRRYKTYNRARVVRDKRTGKSRGYGFVSFGDPHDMLKALTEMDRKYVGNRPIRVLKSRWKDREVDSEKNKKLSDLVRATPTGSRTLKKFKKIKPVTGGKRAMLAREAPVKARTQRGYHGPRPPPFGNFGHIARGLRGNASSGNASYSNKDM
eukprot:Lankesteria_metandrocarpae@DN1479_c0_g1_i1.p1